MMDRSQRENGGACGGSVAGAVGGGGGVGGLGVSGLYYPCTPSERLTNSCRLNSNNTNSTTSTTANHGDYTVEQYFIRTLEKVYSTIEKNKQRLAEQDRREAIKRDWQQVALVVDRLLLVVFMVATLSITSAILLHAPHSREFLFGPSVQDALSTNHSQDGSTHSRQANASDVSSTVDI